MVARHSYEPRALRTARGGVKVSSLERPWALAPPNRQVHESASPDPWIQVPSAGDHCSGPSDLQKKVGRCILDLKLSVESDYGAPRGHRASPGRV